MEIQPTDHEMATSRLLYARLEIPADSPFGATGPSEEWRRIVGVGSAFQGWYEQALEEGVAAYGVVPPRVESRVVLRPPMAGPLIPQFFIDLDPLVQAILINLGTTGLWDGFTLGIRMINRSLRRQLRDNGLPETAYRISYSPAELEDLCLDYIRRKHHPRATLTRSRESFNTVFDGGYAFPLNRALPMGWMITVSKRRETYAFVVDSFGTILSLEHCVGRACHKHDPPDLFAE